MLHAWVQSHGNLCGRQSATKQILSFTHFDKLQSVVRLSLGTVTYCTSPWWQMRHEELAKWWLAGDNLNAQSSALHTTNPMWAALGSNPWQPLIIITLLIFKIKNAGQWLIEVILIHTWRVEHQCVHRDVPATDTAWRSLYHRPCRWRGVDVRGYASSDASGCMNYLTPWCSLGEGTCKVMIMFGITQASPFECYDWPF
jgi:hypothetical protein